ncbi:MAG TPA: hypothetical protein VGG33_25020 [Polyangia bacterium]
MIVTADDVLFTVVGALGVVSGASFTRSLLRALSNPVLEPSLRLGLYLGGVVCIGVVIATPWFAWRGFRDPTSFQDGRRYQTHGWAQGILCLGGASLAFPFALMPLVYHYARARYGVATEEDRDRMRKQERNRDRQRRKRRS